MQPTSHKEDLGTIIDTRLHRKIQKEEPGTCVYPTVFLSPGSQGVCRVLFVSDIDDEGIPRSYLGPSVSEERVATDLGRTTEVRSNPELIRV